MLGAARMHRDASTVNDFSKRLIVGDLTAEARLRCFFNKNILEVSQFNSRSFIMSRTKYAKKMLIESNRRHCHLPRSDSLGGTHMCRERHG